MNATKLNAKISQMEQSATKLIELAHYMAVTTGQGEKQWRTRDLLKAAREYARTVNAVVRHKEYLTP